MATLRALDSARPHVSAPARCGACGHTWVAVVPDLPQARENLECPACHDTSDATHVHRVHNALEVVDDLRRAVLSGRVVAFAAVGIEENDATIAWSSCTQDVSRLRVIGAIAHLGHSYAHGDEI